jgi:hypothetical protein
MEGSFVRPHVSSLKPQNGIRLALILDSIPQSQAILIVVCIGAL